MSDPTIGPECTCSGMCDEDPGCCQCCGGYGSDVGCMGTCWDCRGTGHPHPLDNPECPEHRLTDGPAPVSSPDAVTIWCTDCEGTADVVEDWRIDTDPRTGLDWRVRRLDCGHEECTSDAHCCRYCGEPGGDCSYVCC